MHILKDNLSSCVLARDILKALSLRQKTNVNKLTLHKTNLKKKNIKLMSREIQPHSSNI